MRELLIMQTLATVAGFALDVLIGDPAWLPHPVMAIGKLIAFFERRLRRGGKGDTARGAITVIAVCLVSSAVPAALLFGAWKISKYLYLAINAVMCWQIIAARQLTRESAGVRRLLESGDIEGARRALSNIVGRDTAALDEAGVIRAAVETVAENASDGIIAPMFYNLLFGAVGGFLYKAVNTMDSMLGYKNEKYLYFGRIPARTDDVFNFVPSRLCAVLMLLCCRICRLDAKNALRIFRRDRFKHASPNSAQTESLCAGALNVRLAGDAYYGGVLHKKEYIGDDIRPVEPRDITRVNRLAYSSAVLALVLTVIIRSSVILCL